MTIEDAGVFECVANNGIPRRRPVELRQQIFLHVNCKELHNCNKTLSNNNNFTDKPIIMTTSTNSKFAADRGEDARLECVAYTTPNVTFQWAKGGKVLATKGTKYSVTEETPDPITRKSVLSVKRVTPSDYGSYSCVALNLLGEGKGQIVLSPRSVPNTPSKLHVTGSTYNSVNLSWNLGFDGGFDQYVRVRYRQIRVRGRDAKWLIEEVLPFKSSEVRVGGLMMDTEYIFSVMAYNKLGDSDYSPTVIGRTASE